MSVSFLRIDDRMIHGQTVTRWSLEYPCDGLIAVNDRAANTKALKMAYKSVQRKLSCGLMKHGNRKTRKYLIVKISIS